MFYNCDFTKYRKTFIHPILCNFLHFVKSSLVITVHTLKHYIKSNTEKLKCSTPLEFKYAYQGWLATLLNLRPDHFSKVLRHSSTFLTLAVFFPGHTPYISDKQ